MGELPIEALRRLLAEGEASGFAPWEGSAALIAEARSRASEGPKLMRVRARIALLSTADGGRATPVSSDYRPNHDLWEGGDMHVGRILLADEQWLAPGDATEAIVEFFYLPGLRERLPVGAQWLIREGGRLVGHGTVLELLS